MSNNNNSQNISVRGSSQVSFGNIEHKTVGGDSINMSGDFRGANVNVKSQLSQASQHVGSSSSVEQTAKEQLQDLLKKLNVELQKVPGDKSNEAEAVALFANDLVSKVTDEKRNPAVLKLTGEGLKQATQSLADTVPLAVSIATQIVTLVMGMV